jgi:hypothetical protein
MDNANSNQSNIKPLAPWYMRAIYWVAGVASSVYRTTVRYIKNIPSKIANFYRRKKREHDRMPKRTSASKVYVLIGYTSKKNVDRKYRREKVLYRLRSVLILAIIIVLLVMIYQAIIPMIDSSEYKQMLGIEKIEKMAEKDPFETEKDNDIILFSAEDTTPLPTTIQSEDN